MGTQYSHLSNFERCRLFEWYHKNNKPDTHPKFKKPNKPDTHPKFCTFRS